MTLSKVQKFKVCIVYPLSFVLIFPFAVLGAIVELFRFPMNLYREVVKVVSESED